MPVLGRKHEHAWFWFISRSMLGSGSLRIQYFSYERVCLVLVHYELFSLKKQVIVIYESVITCLNIMVVII